MPEPVIDVRGLEKSYGRFRQKMVLKGVDLAVSPGEWAKVEREWSPGDTITIELPMALRALPVAI